MDAGAIERLQEYAEGRERMGHSGITAQRRKDVAFLLDRLANETRRADSNAQPLAAIAESINLHKYVPADRDDLAGLCEDDDCLWWDMTYALRDDLASRCQGTDWTRVDPNITRVEVVDDTGRAFVRYYEAAGVEVHMQDEGRTLKVFAKTPRRPSAGSPDYWCNTCNRGAEGCTHPIEEK